MTERTEPEERTHEPQEPGERMPDAPTPVQESDEDVPELLRKLQERKERHEQRGIVARIGVVVIGVVVVLVGIVLSGPGVPGPGILVILIGLSFLALEFDWAERLLERAIIWGDRAAERAENASPRQKAITAVLAVLALAAFAAAAILWDIPLVPIL